eukprot:3715763-Prymnesium_polylepis.2
MRACVEVGDDKEGCVQREKRRQYGPRVPRRGCTPNGQPEAQRAHEQARRREREEEVVVGVSSSIGVNREEVELESDRQWPD